MKNAIVALSVLAALSLSENAMAYSKGDHILKGGMNISDPSVLVDIKGISSEISFAASYGYMVTDHLSLEVAATTPSKYEFEKLFDIKKSTYTAMVNYHLGDVENDFRPYAGFGLAYVDLSGDLLPGDRFFETEISGGFGGAVQIGMDWQITDNLIAGFNTKVTATEYELKNMLMKKTDTFGDVSATIHIGYNF